MARLQSLWTEVSIMNWRRFLITLGVLGLTAITAYGVWHDEDYVARTYWRFADCDTCPLLGPAINRRFWAYNLHLGTDTTAAGSQFTMLADSTYWLASKWGIYDIWQYSDSGATLMVNDYPIQGPTVPPSAIHTESTYVFLNVVVDSLHSHHGTIDNLVLTNKLNSTAVFPFVPDSSIYGTVELGEAAGDTLYTLWKSGATMGDLVLCGWVDHPLNGFGGSAVINAQITGSKKISVYRYPAVSMTYGGHTIWVLVVGRTS
jgi:hypothetical protein